MCKSKAEIINHSTAVLVLVLVFKATLVPFNHTLTTELVIRDNKCIVTGKTHESYSKFKSDCVFCDCHLFTGHIKNNFSFIYIWHFLLRKFTYRTFNLCLSGFSPCSPASCLLQSQHMHIRLIDDSLVSLGVKTSV